ncbi:MAG: histidine triad nucleotide-binding protein [Deltaproteobacteria bacterium RIFCSPHIGHO2_02_FULL_40_11]|nr:MAG: histidine triad nucleotide-binding protein [Deltaproteobacteria bacterium RIFCSPHIGHO2_02_FULL_40_11]
MKECLFCKIIAGSIKSEKVYEDEHVFAFKDIHPKAPIHVLIVPKQHIDSLAKLDESNADVLKPVFLAAQKIVKEEGVLERGFRTVFNCNPEGGQLVYHLHLHLLAGKQLGGGMGA